MTRIFKKKKLIMKEEKRQHKNGEAVTNLIMAAPLYRLAQGPPTKTKLIKIKPWYLTQNLCGSKTQ